MCMYTILLSYNGKLPLYDLCSFNLNGISVNRKLKLTPKPAELYYFVPNNFRRYLEYEEYDKKLDTAAQKCMNKK